MINSKNYGFHVFKQYCTLAHFELQVLMIYIYS